jgi:obg-like ATPase 1
MLSFRTTFAFALVKRVRLGRPGTSLKIGLLGMANIGKSSTFNILSNLNVPAENIPFCTI